MDKNKVALFIKKYKILFYGIVLILVLINLILSINAKAFISIVIFSLMLVVFIGSLLLPIFFKKKN
jgi:hypothetical protein